MDMHHWRMPEGLRWPTFEIPVTALDTPLDVVGDTVAMSTPHEIEYTLTFASASLIEAK